MHPHPHPYTLTHKLLVLYHTTLSLHLFITPFRWCKSSKVNFSLNLPRARRHRCIVRRCSTRTRYIYTQTADEWTKNRFPGDYTAAPLATAILNLYIHDIMCIYNERVNHAFHRFVFGGIFFPVNNNNILFSALRSPHASCLQRWRRQSVILIINVGAALNYM